MQKAERKEAGNDRSAQRLRMMDFVRTHFRSLIVAFSLQAMFAILLVGTPVLPEIRMALITV